MDLPIMKKSTIRKSEIFNSKTFCEKLFDA